MKWSDIQADPATDAPAPAAEPPRRMKWSDLTQGSPGTFTPSGDARERSGEAVQPGLFQRMWDGLSGKDVSRAGRFGMGVGDPFYGGAQIGARMAAMPGGGVPEAAGVMMPDPQADERIKTVDTAVQNRETGYQQREKAAGLGGFSSEWARLLGNVASPPNLAVAGAGGAAGAGAGLAGRLGAATAMGAASGAMEPVASGNFGAEKMKQGGLGALGGLAAGGAGEALRPLGQAIAPALTAAQQRLRDFTQAGVRPNVPVIGQGGFAGRLAQGGKALPFSPTIQGTRNTLVDTAGAAERSAAGFGAATDEFSAGSVARNAARQFAGDRSTADREFGEFFRLMHGAKPVDMTRTNRLLDDLMGRFPNAPELRGLFTNPKLGTMARALERRTETTPPVASPILDEFGRPSVVRPGQTVERGGSLSMPELREMRSQIGYMLENPSFGPEAIPKAQLKRLYGALTADMRTGAAQQGPAATRALSRATINYGQRMKLIERLEPLMDPDAPEQVFARIEKAARSSGGADAGLLRAGRRVMSPEEWGNVGAVTIRRLGNPSPGAARVRGDPEFSVNTFATNWNKLSGRAKDLLFGDNAPDSGRAGLERLARIANDQKAFEGLANTSKTWEVGAVSTLVGELIGQVATGRFPIPELAAYGGLYGAGKLMMNPAFTRWLYKMPMLAQRAQSSSGLEKAAINALRFELRNVGQQAAPATGETTARQRPPISYTPTKPLPPVRPSVIGG